MCSNKTHIRESLATSGLLAFMRSLTGMGTDMNSQGATLDEGFVATAERTTIEALISVDFVMPRHIGLSGEHLSLVSAESAL